MWVLYVIWAVLLLRFEPGATSNIKTQEDQQTNTQSDIRAKLDEVVLENRKLSEAYGKLIQAIKVHVIGAFGKRCRTPIGLPSKSKIRWKRILRFSDWNAMFSQCILHVSQNKTNFADRILF